MTGRLFGHLGMALCWVSVAVGCSSGPPNTTGSESTSRGTAGGRSNGSATGAGSGGAQTSGSSGGLTGGNETGGSSGGRVGCASACSLPGQYCDDAGQCVSCLVNSDCKSTLQPFCYNDAGPNFGSCVECVATSECRGGEVCSPELLCVPGCGTTNSCGGETPICADSGVCVTCLSARDCNGGLVCRNGACTVCTNDYECAMNYPNPPLWVCSPEENCVQCRIDADCPDGQHCVGTGCH